MFNHKRFNQEVSLIQFLLIVLKIVIYANVNKGQHVFRRRKIQLYPWYVRTTKYYSDHVTFPSRNNNSLLLIALLQRCNVLPRRHKTSTSYIHLSSVNFKKLISYYLCLNTWNSSLLALKLASLDFLLNKYCFMHSFLSARSLFFLFSICNVSIPTLQSFTNFENSAFLGKTLWSIKISFT